jgi:hypothetical protein
MCKKRTINNNKYLDYLNVFEILCILVLTAYTNYTNKVQCIIIIYINNSFIHNI